MLVWRPKKRIFESYDKYSSYWYFDLFRKHICVFRALRIKVQVYVDCDMLILLFQYRRAIYSDADIYMLDDPLSAVDANVGRHLYDK